MTKRRNELLAACLTIWLWGRHNQNLDSGTPLGSFEQWCRWVRDPLLALGCQDPVTRVSEAKRQDSQRQRVSEIFLMWSDKHGDRAIQVKDLNEDLKNLIDPQQRSRQYLNTQVQRLVGTRIAGFVLVRNKSEATWTSDSYMLKKNDGAENHRGHKGHRVSDDPPAQSNLHPNDRDLIKPELRSSEVSVETGDVPAATCDPYDPYAFGGQDSESHNPVGWTGQI